MMILLRSPGRVALLTATLLLSSALLVASVPEEARGQSGGGGRIYNPKRLRARPEPPARGRILRDPRKVTTEPRQPLRRRALIPNPEPQTKGGRGYVKKGDFYYQVPGQIRAGGNPKQHVERVKIPHPNAKLR